MALKPPVQQFDINYVIYYNVRIRFKIFWKGWDIFPCTNQKQEGCLIPLPGPSSGVPRGCRKTEGYHVLLDFGPAAQPNPELRYKSAFTSYPSVNKWLWIVAQILLLNTYIHSHTFAFAKSPFLSVRSCPLLLSASGHNRKACSARKQKDGMRNKEGRVKIWEEPTFFFCQSNRRLSPHSLLLLCAFVFHSCICLYCPPPLCAIPGVAFLSPHDIFPRFFFLR